MIKPLIFNKALLVVFHSKIYLLLFLIFSLLFLWTFIYIPSQIIPGNDFLFQISLFKNLDWLLLILTSFLTSLLLVFNIFVFKLKQQAKRHYKRRGIGLLFGTIGGLIGSFTCAACALSVLGFISFGTLVFLTQYRVQISLLVIFIISISLYYSSQVILGLCDSCKI